MCSFSCRKSPSPRRFGDAWAISPLLPLRAAAAFVNIPHRLLVSVYGRQLLSTRWRLGDYTVGDDIFPPPAHSLATLDINLTTVGVIISITKSYLHSRTDRLTRYQCSTTIIGECSTVLKTVVWKWKERKQQFKRRFSPTMP